jgi:hypothetical protein
MDETYQTLIYHEHGGDRMGIRSAGVLELAGEDIAGDDLRRAVISNQLMDSQNFAAGVNTLSISNLPKNIGTYIIWASAAAAGTDASFWLTSVSAGRECWLGLAGDSTGVFTNALTTIVVSCSGCIILGSFGGHVSKFTMNASAASDVLVHLLAVVDNQWAIIDQRGSVVESSNL